MVRGAKKDLGHLLEAGFLLNSLCCLKGYDVVLLEELPLCAVENENWWHFQGDQSGIDEKSHRKCQFTE